MIYPYNEGNAKNVVQYKNDSEVAQILKLTNEHIDDVDFKKFDKKTFMFFKNKIDFSCLPNGTKFGNIIQKKEFSKSGKTSYNVGYFNSKEAINDCQVEKTIFSENEIYNSFYLIKLTPIEVKKDCLLVDFVESYCENNDNECRCSQCEDGIDEDIKEKTLMLKNVFNFAEKGEFVIGKIKPIPIGKEIYFSVSLRFSPINLGKIKEFYKNFELIPKIVKIFESIKSNKYEIFIYDKDFNLSYAEVFDDSLRRIS